MLVAEGKWFNAHMCTYTQDYTQPRPALGQELQSVPTVFHPSHLVTEWASIHLFKELRDSLTFSWSLCLPAPSQIPVHP